VLKVFASLLVPGEVSYKYFDFPNCNYASSSFDGIVMGGSTVGFSMFGGYSYNERTVLSLGVVDPDIEIGDVLTLLWGEENGGTRKTTSSRTASSSPGASLPDPVLAGGARAYHRAGALARPDRRVAALVAKCAARRANASVRTGSPVLVVGAALSG